MHLETQISIFKWFINSLIVELILCGGYDTIISRVTDINKKKVEDSSDTTNTTENNSTKPEENKITITENATGKEEEISWNC